MKKQVIACALTCLSTSLVHADPSLYGRIFMIGDYSDSEFDSDERRQSDTIQGDIDEDNFDISSHKSVIGIEGSEPITASTNVIYKLEYDVDVAGDRGTLENRTTYLGLSNKRYGDILVGRYFSPVDQINDVNVTQGYWDNLGTTSLPSDSREVAALNMIDAPPRVSNSVTWLSPEYDNLPLKFVAMYVADETFDDAGSDDGYGAAITFDQGKGLTASIGYDKDIELVGDLIRGTVTYDLSHMTALPVTLGALYQQADYDNRSKKEKGYILSANMNVDRFSHPATVYVQYNNSTNLDGIDHADSEQIVLGGTYSIRDNLVAHAYAGYNTADDVTAVVGTSQDANGNERFITANGDSEVLAIGGGLQYFF